MSSAHRPEVTKATRAVGALAIVVVLVAVAVVGVRASYGFFSDDISVTFVLPRAGQALGPGDFVEYRGVEVGKVHSISLVDGHVRIEARLDHGVKVPHDVRASVEPLTFFGNKFIDLTDTDGDAGPYLTDGATITDTSVGDEVETLLAKLVPVLQGINTNDLTTVLTELDETLRNGEGQRIGQSFDEGVKMATLFRTTLDAQIQALTALNRFSAAVADYGPVINSLSNSLNGALPVFNDARAKFEKLLATLGPFADDLASLLSVNRPDIDRILDEGGNIVRVVTAHQQDIADTIQGLANYLYAFASGVGPDVLPNGQHPAYFKIFVDATNLTNLICGLVANVPAQLSDLRQALFGQNGLIDCSTNVRTVPQVGASSAASATTTATAPATAPASGSGGSSGSAGAPTQQLANQVYGQLAQPDPGTTIGLGPLIQKLLGGGG